jgi:hypothetical protein
MAANINSTGTTRTAMSPMRQSIHKVTAIIRQTVTLAELSGRAALRSRSSAAAASLWMR